MVWCLVTVLTDDLLWYPTHTDRMFLRGKHKGGVLWLDVSDDKGVSLSVMLCQTVRSFGEES